MGFSIEKVTVTANTRALKAEYSMELAQDLKAVHGLDAETELSNILSSEILAEINREVVRTIYGTAVSGAQIGTTTRGTFDLDTDSNGRWMVEKVKGLAFQIEREANAIAKTTRRGKGKCYGQCLTAVGWVGGTLPELYEEDGMVELSMADVAGGAIVTGVALSGERAIYVVRYQGFQWYNATSIVNYAAKSKV